MILREFHWVKKEEVHNLKQDCIRTKIIANDENSERGEERNDKW